MGIIARFKDIMSANINALLDKAEDPAVMIDEYMRQVAEELAEVKKETASIMAEETACKRKLDNNAAEIKKWDNYARKAVQAGNDGDAKKFLAKKQEYVELSKDLQKAYDVAHDNATKMRQMHDKLTKDYQSLEQRRKNVKQKVAVAKTQEKLNAVDDSVASAQSAMRAFEKMEAKADKMLDTVNAMAELNEEPEDSAEVLTFKYDLDEMDVDDELAKLKAEMGIE